MSISPNHRNTIDQEVYKWASQQSKKKKLVTPNAIRQKAYEIGQEYDPNFKASLNWFNNWKKRYDYSDSPEAEALKHKKRSYTAAFKLHAVQRAMELESASQASLELDVSRRCLQRWKDELDLIASVAEHSSNAVYRRPGQGRKVTDSNLDSQLLEWVQDCWKQGISVSSGLVREKARELSTRPDFKASLGWFVKWQRRNHVDLKEQTCGTPTSDSVSPLKLRLLPEGEVSCYSTPSTRPKAKKRKLAYDDEALLENDEEFDRLLLTWLVERWEAGDIVADRMVKDKAMELTTNPDFKSSKSWLLAWKRKYNVSLENQTYGNEGEEENEEIVEESEVYDNEVLLEEQQQQQPLPQAVEGGENPLTPTKEEAATTLASLSAEDHEAAGLEIAEALQKLAKAFEITSQGGEVAKETMAQLTAAYQSDNPEFLLEGTGQVAVEEVISEEVITDEPMVVIETPEVDEGTTSTITSSSTIATGLPATTIITTIPSMMGTGVTVSSIASVPTGLPGQIQSIQTEATTQPVISMASAPSTVVSTSPISTFISEEVVISEPATTSTVPIDNQVEVLVQGGGGIVVYTPQDASDTILQADVETEDIVQQSSVEGMTLETQDVIVQQSSSLLPPIITDVTTEQAVSGVPTQVVTVMPEVPTISEEVNTSMVQTGSDSISKQMADVVATALAAAGTQDVSIPVATQEILDLVQETIGGSGEKTIEESSTQRIYDEGFKAKVVSRAQELGSVQQAAREFSVPWRAVATWNTQESNPEKMQ